MSTDMELLEYWVTYAQFFICRSHIGVDLYAFININASVLVSAEYQGESLTIVPCHACSAMHADQQGVPPV